MRREKKTYNVRTYWCRLCGHIFSTASNGEIGACRHCGGELKIIDRYKSRIKPRGHPPPGRHWQVKEGLHERRRLGVRGTVRKWYGRYGFIKPDGGGGDLFVHESDLVGMSALYEFNRVEFDVTPTPRGLKAVNVKVILLNEGSEE